MLAPHVCVSWHSWLVSHGALHSFVLIMQVSCQYTQQIFMISWLRFLTLMLMVMVLLVCKPFSTLISFFNFQANTVVCPLLKWTVSHAHENTQWVWHPAAALVPPIADRTTGSTMSRYHICDDDVHQRPFINYQLYAKPTGVHRVCKTRNVFLLSERRNQPNVSKCLREGNMVLRNIFTDTVHGWYAMLNLKHHKFLICQLS